MKSTIEELNAFVTIVDCGSIVMAAQQLNQTTSGVSRALQRLEQKLNVTLLERTTRKLKLTDGGQQFLIKARKILSELAEAEESIQHAESELAGLIRIDSATPFILHVIVPLIDEFMQRYPKIDIELSNHDQIIDLLEHKTDVAIRFGELEDSTLHAKLLCKSRLYIVASPAYLAKNGQPSVASDLQQHTLLGFSRPVHLNTWPIEVDGRPYTIAAKIKSSNGETVRKLALQGIGITCLSRFLVEQDLAKGTLVALLEDQIQLSEQKIHAVYYQQNFVPKRIRVFIDYLAEKLKEYL